MHEAILDEPKRLYLQSEAGLPSRHEACQPNHLGQGGSVMGRYPGAD